MRYPLTGSLSPAAARIAPFATFMGCIAVEELLAFLGSRGSFQASAQFMQWLYLPKLVATGGVLLWCWPAYTEIQAGDFRNLANTLASLLGGLLIFILWINLDWTFAFQSQPRGFDPAFFTDAGSRWLMVAARIAGAVVVVPVMEELFWRSWLLRYLEKSDFQVVPVGNFAWFPFLSVSVLFGLEHHFIIAGIVAGVLFNGIYCYTKSITQCIFAHAVANLCLAGYVLASGQWIFW